MKAPTNTSQPTWAWLLGAIVDCATRDAGEDELELHHYAWICDQYQSAMGKLESITAAAMADGHDYETVRALVVLKVDELRQHYTALDSLEQHRAA
jgi:hypothetical protein